MLGAAPAPGTFGETVTLSSFGAEPVRIGDRFRLGPVLVEVTAPRIPCSVFATRMEQPAWVKRFADARRPGLYVRVLEPGEIAAGDPVERLDAADEHPTAIDLMDVWYDPEPAPELLERLLRSPLAERARVECRGQARTCRRGSVESLNTVRLVADDADMRIVVRSNKEGQWWWAAVDRARGSRRRLVRPTRAAPTACERSPS